MFWESESNFKWILTLTQINCKYYKLRSLDIKQSDDENEIWQITSAKDRFCDRGLSEARMR